MEELDWNKVYHSCTWGRQWITYTQRNKKLKKKKPKVSFHADNVDLISYIMCFNSNWGAFHQMWSCIRRCLGNLQLTSACNIVREVKTTFCKELESGFCVQQLIYLYSILSLSGGGHPFHPICHPSCHPSIQVPHPGRRRWKRRRKEEEEWWQQQFIYIYIILYNILGDFTVSEGRGYPLVILLALPTEEATMLCSDSL